MSVRLAPAQGSGPLWRGGRPGGGVGARRPTPQPAQGSGPPWSGGQPGVRAPGRESCPNTRGHPSIKSKSALHQENP